MDLGLKADLHNLRDSEFQNIRAAVPAALSSFDRIAYAGEHDDIWFPWTGRQAQP